jgi:hypothetical protein
MPISKAVRCSRFYMISSQMAERLSALLHFQ